MSLSSVLSEGERRFICGGIDVGLRSDGRSCTDYQLISIERDVAHHCDGSAHVRCGNNDVMVGVKLDVEEVTQREEWDHCGRIDFFADVTANASPQFEGRQGEDISNEIVALFSHSIPSCIDLKSLVIIENKSFWVLHVDIVILECASFSSLVDVAAIAVKAALYDTKIPKVIIISQEANEFDVSEDAFEASKLDVSQVPIFVTLTRISTQYVVDVTRDEESASIASISLAVNSNGIVFMKKFGCGSLHPDPLKDILEKAKQIGILLNQNLMEKLKIEPQNKGKIGFSLS